MATFPLSPKPVSVIKAPIFSTLIVGYGNTIEQRIQLNSIAQWSFALTFLTKEVGSLDVFVDFFLARKGAFEQFYFQNTAEAYRTVVWLTNHAYSVGNIIRPVTPNGRSYICTIAGTSGGSEPTWGVVVNGNTTDGGVTWKENTYTVRFAEDSHKFDYFYRSLMNQGTLVLLSVGTNTCAIHGGGGV